MTTEPLATGPHAVAPVVAHEPLPDPHIWAAHIAQAILDTLFGTRPPQQLIRWTDSAVYGTILSARSTDPPAHGTRRPTVRRVRIFMPVEHAAEASVLLQVGPRYRAAAMRLEGVGQRWMCTAFQLL